MCFSATASFAAAAVLAPAGIYCVKKASTAHKPYWAFALLPLGFGVQQALEGALWMALDAGNADAGRVPALGFMFFSHFFWLFWVPTCCYLVEQRAGRRALFLAIAIVGAVYGALMYLPAVLFPQWLTIGLAQHSIVYETRLVFDGFLPREVVRGIYALVVLVPLLLCTNAYFRWFGVIIAVSLLVARLFFDYAFVSIWCYFAAVLSVYVVFVIHRATLHQETPPLAHEPAG